MRSAYPIRAFCDLGGNLALSIRNVSSWHISAVADVRYLVAIGVIADIGQGS
jgi:hypothetical protein